MFTLIRNAHVYAPEDKGIQNILVCNDKIIAMGPDLEFSFAGLESIDARGKYAIPGLLDQHVHITGGGGESSFRSRIREIGLADIIESGVTTVVGLLGTDSITRSVENLVAKTKALNEEGITAYCLTGAYTYPTQTLTGSVQKDIAFVQEIIGVKLAISDHRSSMPTREELARLATQVRQAALISGKAGVVHMHTGVGKAKLSDVIAVVEESDIPIRHFRPTHIGRMPEEAVRFAKMGGYIDFTTGDDADATAGKILTALEQVPLELVTVSSDSNGSAPVWNGQGEVIGMKVGKMTTLYDTVRHMIVTLHVSPEKALSLITANVAKALEIYPRKGHLAVNADADIVLMDEEWRLDFVMAKGKKMMEEKRVLERGYYQYE